MGLTSDDAGLLRAVNMSTRPCGSAHLSTLAALSVARRLVGCAGQITCAGSRETWSAILKDRPRSQHPAQGPERQPIDQHTGRCGCHSSCRAGRSGCGAAPARSLRRRRRSPRLRPTAAPSVSVAFRMVGPSRERPAARPGPGAAAAGARGRDATARREQRQRASGRPARRRSAGGVDAAAHVGSRAARRRPVSTSWRSAAWGRSGTDRGPAAAPQGWKGEPTAGPGSSCREERRAEPRGLLRLTPTPERSSRRARS
jgi:hypothetical protein